MNILKKTYNELLNKINTDYNYNIDEYMTQYNRQLIGGGPPLDLEKINTNLQTITNVLNGLNPDVLMNKKDKLKTKIENLLAKLGTIEHNVSNVNNLTNIEELLPSAELPQYLDTLMTSIDNIDKHVIVNKELNKLYIPYARNVDILTKKDLKEIIEHYKTEITKKTTEDDFEKLEDEINKKKEYIETKTRELEQINGQLEIELKKKIGIDSTDSTDSLWDIKMEENNISQLKFVIPFPQLLRKIHNISDDKLNNLKQLTEYIDVSNNKYTIKNIQESEFRSKYNKIAFTIDAQLLRDNELPSYYYNGADTFKIINNVIVDSGIIEDKINVINDIYNIDINNKGQVDSQIIQLNNPITLEEIYKGPTIRQSGGTYELVKTALNNLWNSIKLYRKEYNKYIHINDKFNIISIYEITYTMYLMSILTNHKYIQHYSMLRFIGRGTINYYKRILDNIIIEFLNNQEINRNDETAVKKNMTLKLMKKRYFLVVMRLNNALNKISQAMNSSQKIDVMECSGQVKEQLLILSHFKVILDDYNLLFQNRLTIYGRLNDINFKINTEPYVDEIPNYTNDEEYNTKMLEYVTKNNSANNDYWTNINFLKENKFFLSDNDRKNIYAGLIFNVKPIDELKQLYNQPTKLYNVFDVLKLDYETELKKDISVFYTIDFYKYDTSFINQQTNTDMNDINITTLYNNLKNVYNKLTEINTKLIDNGPSKQLETELEIYKKNENGYDNTILETYNKLDEKRKELETFKLKIIELKNEFLSEKDKLDKSIEDLQSNDKKDKKNIEELIGDYSSIGKQETSESTVRGNKASELREKQHKSTKSNVQQETEYIQNINRINNNINTLYEEYIEKQYDKIIIIDEIITHLKNTYDSLRDRIC